MSPHKSADIAEDPPTLVELEEALSGAISDLEAWASAGPEGMTSEERTRFKGYERVLERSRGGSCRARNNEERGDE